MSEYTEQAKKFLADSGTTCKIHKIGTVKGFPFDKKDTYYHNKYQVVMKRGDKIYDFPFYDSARNYMENKRPTAYDVLACLEKYEPYGGVWEFAREFGYEIDSEEEYKRVSKIRQECINQYEHLYDMFGDEWMPQLQEIA